MKKLTPSLSLEIDLDGVGTLWFDVPGASMNTLRPGLIEEFQEAFKALRESRELKALVFASGKPSGFIAGADLQDLSQVKSEHAGAHLSQTGQAALHQLEALPFPVVAAISGPCLGGGLELALACKARIGSTDPKTKLGLPEVQLGLLPGMGGTQRLAPLIGLEKALDLLLTGKQLDPMRAARMGLLDAAVPPALLLPLAKEKARALAQTHSAAHANPLKHLLDKDELKEALLTETALGRKVVFDQAHKKLMETTRGNYPAPERILAVVRLGLERGRKAGFEAEATAFGELLQTSESKALRHIFFADQALKKDADSAEAPELIGVIGAGLMGAGIALVTAERGGGRVRLEDRDRGRIQAGLLSVAEALNEKVQKGRMTEREKARIFAQITASHLPGTMGGAGLVIEAVPEDLALKREVLKTFELHAKPAAVFATNTSAIPIREIALSATRPERVLGMHYFSPVPKMPLLEIITTPKTSPEALKTARALGKKQGKTVIVVRDGPGFFTTRILGPYLNEAARALVEGYSIEDIDTALLDRGFPVGPLALLDEIGIDVGSKVAHVLEQHLGARMAPPRELEKLVQDGRLGRKAKNGFYRYDEAPKKGRAREADASVYSALGLGERRKAGPAERAQIAERCLLMMVNEAFHCLNDGILDRPDDGDIGAIYGLGFPPFLGGPFHFAEQYGKSNLRKRLVELSRKCGDRFVPSLALG